MPVIALPPLPDFTLHAFDAFSFTFYAYQLDPAKTTLFQDKRVRQALAYALDRDALVRDLHHGFATPAQGTLPPSSWAYQPDKLTTRYTYDVQRAESLLDRAGWVRGANGIRAREGQALQFTLWTNAGGTLREEYAARIQHYWRAIGVAATPRAEEWSAFFARITRTQDFEVCLTGLSLGIDPDQTMLWATGAALNLGRYSNPRVDALLTQGLTTLDTEQRKAIYLELQNILMDEAPSVFLDFPHSGLALNGRVQNLIPNAVNLRWNAHLWWVEDGR